MPCSQLQAAEDAYWADDDKLVNRKLQRKDDAEQKAEALKRKEENRKLAEEEMNSIASKSCAGSAKVTRAAIERQREADLLARLQEQRLKTQEAAKIAVVDHLQDNINQMNLNENAATTVDEAISVFGGNADEDDKHPEKRMKAAYLAFEETCLPQLKNEHPTFRLSQLKQILKKEWQKSPENPLNARLLAMSKVFYGAEIVKYELEDIKQMTSTDVILAVTKAEPEPNMFLSKSGKLFEHDVSLSTVGLTEHDFLRIIQKQDPPGSLYLKKPMSEVEPIFKECCQILRKEQNGVQMMKFLNALSDNDFVPKQRKKYPQLIDMPYATGYLCDPLLLLSVIKDSKQNLDFFKANFELLEIVHEELKAASQVPSIFQNMFQPFDGQVLPSAQQSPSAPAAQRRQPGGDITADILRQAIEFAMGRGPPPGSPEAVTGAGAAAPALPLPPQPEVPPPVVENSVEELRQRYSSELAQIHEFGLGAADEIVLQLLFQNNGNVQATLELLIEMNN